ncbi:MAG: substrate-binding domain-containing protein [Anaerolineae bacterium]|nr:substrate-binding domain-containing protein [Anaerolineae bacterium]
MAHPDGANVAYPCTVVHMRGHMRIRPTIGVLPGWQAYGGTLDSFLGHVLRGIQAASREMGCNLLLSCGVSSPHGRELAPAWPLLVPGVDFVPVGPWNTDGLIAVPPLLLPETAQYCQDLIAQGHPVVFAGAGEPGPAVMVDNEGGIRKALSHLVQHGHRRIALVAGQEEPALGDSARRIAAYKEGLRSLGLPFDPDLIADGSCTPAGGRQAMRRVLSTGASFTAVLGINDGAAQGAMEALREAGLLVPQDVAVVGFDDRLEARTLTPPLTSIRHPMFEMGYRAVLLLLKYIEGAAQGVETVLISTQLVIRESCGCLPGAVPGAQGDGQAGGAALPSARQEIERAPDAPRGTDMIGTMSAAVSAGMPRLSQDEVLSLCQRLVAAFTTSLERADPMDFRLAMQQIPRSVSHSGDDPHAWQAAVTILREAAPSLIELCPSALSARAVDDMLDQARVAISEVTRDQYTRHLIRQAAIAEQVGQMTARFLAARDEAEVFRVLAESLPQVGIEHAVVAQYEGEGDDPRAWSVLLSTHGLGQAQRRFRSRAFPPPGLYAEDRPFSLALLPLLDPEGPIGFVAFDGGNLDPCAAIARQLGAALRGVRLYREAVEGRRLAEEADRLKSRFLSMVSHELRTPLNLIAGLSDMLLREGEAVRDGRLDVKREDLERIYVSAQHLDGLIRDVLDLAQSEVGQLKLVCEPVDLVEVLRPLAVIGEHLAQDKGLAWRAEVPDHLPQVWADRTRLRQVVLNLVNNAVKFTSQGGIVLSVSVQGDSVRVAVRDTGLGIPAEEQDVIFDEFRQSERTTARGYGGLGLGLAICKRLVEMHGGEIGVSSSGEVGGGSTFYFTLPLAQRHRALPGRVSHGPARHVVLLAKDGEGGEFLKQHLVRQGFEVDLCLVDGMTHWLAWLLASPPEAVVLDLGLASEYGWEILKILKENPATQNVPVLFYNLADDRGSGSVLRLDFLTKPVGTAELAAAVAVQGGDRGGKKLLVVDDEPEALEVYARILQAQSPEHRVLRARDGREALTIIRDERPDLVLLDLMMPEVDGFGVLEAMREDEASRNIPVIVLTGQALTQQDIARLNRSVASILGKGLFTIDETLRHIEMALDGRRKLSMEAQQVVRRAMAFVHLHYAEPISRRDVAAHVGVSERHLSRCFRHEVGVTLGTYLNRYRVRQARVLLEAGDKSITQVAMDVGFSSSGYFARVFREEVGLSPSAFLRSLCQRRVPPCDLVAKVCPS